MLLTTLALICCVGLLAFIAYKLRKVHLLCYRILADTQTTRVETQALFAQVQAFLALERKLNLPEALPPMRGWAGSPDFLLKAAEAVLKNRPATLMECSSGVSTVVLARCVQMNGHGHVYSLENASDYAAKTRELLERYGLSNWATVLTAPLVTQHTATPWYDESVIPDDLPLLDMVVVDGPPAATAPLARLPALPRLFPRMAENCVVMLDDANRPDEVEILRRWQAQFPQFTQTDHHCEKGLVVLTVPDAHTDN